MPRIDARRLISALSFLFLAVSAMGQTASVKGVVTDEVTENSLLVSVVVRAPTGTSTDFEGVFELSGLPPAWSTRAQFGGLQDGQPARD